MVTYMLENFLEAKTIFLNVDPVQRTIGKGLLIQLVTDGTGGIQDSDSEEIV
jgi:hypothetical protein